MRRRYLVVYLLANGDPGTDYAWGEDLASAIAVWNYHAPAAHCEIISVVKVGEKPGE